MLYKCKEINNIQILSEKYNININNIYIFTVNNHCSKFDCGDKSVKQIKVFLICSV